MVPFAIHIKTPTFTMIKIIENKDWNKICFPASCVKLILTDFNLLSFFLLLTLTGILNNYSLQI